MAAFFLFYKLLLSNETFHKFNRAALLGILFLSTVLPLIEISSAERQLSEIPENLILMLQSAETFLNAESMEQLQQPKTATITWIHAALLIYIAAVILLLVRSIYSAIKLYIHIKNGRRQTIENNITVIVHRNCIAPFSWFKYIVISEKDFEENGNEIIIHEKAHIKKLHSIDLLICHIYSITQWINPVAWLFKRELQTIHEYAADETVLKKGISAKQYQMLLIKKAVGAKLFAMANNFNKSKLKKRIKMMSKNKSNPYAKLKYLYVLPMLVAAVTAFASPRVKTEMEKISSVSISDLIAENKVNRNETTDDSIRVTVFNQYQTNDSTAKYDAVQTVSVITIPDGNSQDTVFVFTETENGKNVNPDALIIVDGEIVDNIGDIDSSRIKSISVIKKGITAQKDGKEKRNVIFIETGKDGNKKSATQVYSSLMSVDPKKRLTYFSCDTILDSVKNYAFSFHFNNNDMKKINMDSLYKPHFYYSKSQNDSLTDWNFYSKSQNASLKDWNFYSKSWNDSLTTWNFYLKSWNDSAEKMNFNHYFNLDSDQYTDVFDPGILIIVDGKEIKFEEFAKMGSQIGTITVLKDEQAVKQYGIKALKGVIIVETKNKNKNEK
jgi:beta-lactamase regulating signal transducer with metallopeptidase domain